MARLLLIIRIGLCLVLHFGASIAADYSDDSDYIDYLDYYELLPEKRVKSPMHGTDYELLRDDFYIASEEIKNRNRRVAATHEMNLKPINSDRWSTTERIYRYTKHRIPGYDYDELDFLETSKGKRCNERSVWTHCLCQFTCIEPNIVDCFTPCTSGCECSENYVYDERTRQCVHPEQCQPKDDYMLY